MNERYDFEPSDTESGDDTLSLPGAESGSGTGFDDENGDTELDGLNADASESEAAIESTDDSGSELADSE